VDLELLKAVYDEQLDGKVTKVAEAIEFARRLLSRAED
jgi:hypothetical protein